MRITASDDSRTPGESFAAPQRGAHDSDPVIGVGTASGKAILFGEHAVVYGHPAIALPLRDLRVRAEAEPLPERRLLHSALYTGDLGRVPDRLASTARAVEATMSAVGADGSGVRVHVESDLPAERGVGSSAAVSAAIVQAVAAAFGHELDPTERHHLIQIAERAAHTSPSGLDARTVVSDRPVWFQDGSAHDLEVAGPLSFVIADSGVRGRTREAVAAVRALRDADPIAVERRLDRLGALAREGRAALASPKPEEIGVRMDEAHALLGELGVGDPALDRLAGIARTGGALGAKLTGGGRGGCVLVLARDPDHATELAHDLRERGAAATWTTELRGTR